MDFKEFGKQELRKAMRLAGHMPPYNRYIYRTNAIKPPLSNGMGGEELTTMGDP